MRRQIGDLRRAASRCLQKGAKRCADPGITCRLQRYTQDARLKAQQDCVLFLQAQKLGFTVLTANIIDFDILLQLMPTGRVLFYRR